MESSIARDEAGFVEKGQIITFISTSVPCVYYWRQLLYQGIKETCGYLLFLKNSIKYFLVVYLIQPQPSTHHFGICRQ